MLLLIVLLARSILRKHRCKTNRAVPSAVVVQSRRPLTATVSFELFCSSTRSRFWRRPRLTRRFEIDTCALPEPPFKSNVWREQLWRGGSRVCAGARIKTCQRVELAAALFERRRALWRREHSRSTRTLFCSSLTLIRIAFICCPLSSTSCEVKDLRLAFDKDLFYTAFSWSFYAARKIFLYARLQ